MKHKLLVFVTLIALLLFVSPKVQAIGLQSDFGIMGVSCGVAGGPDGIDKCCPPPKFEVDLSVPDVSVSHGGGCSGLSLCQIGNAAGAVINAAADVVSVPLSGFAAVFEGAINKGAETAISTFDSGPLGNFTSENTSCFGDAKPTTSDQSDKSCRCVLNDAKELSSIKNLCAQTSPAEKAECEKCVLGQNNQGSAGVWTGIGCVPANLSLFIQQTLLGWAIGLAGFLAFLCILYAAFVMQTSAGNPERIKKAREYLTSCIIGLLLIIFSVFILQVVGVSILRIPGFQ